MLRERVAQLSSVVWFTKDKRKNKDASGAALKSVLRLLAQLAGIIGHEAEAIAPASVGLGFGVLCG